jgi:SagB-type dehydrogenase family enzyme
MIPAEDRTALALLYHLNSEPWLNEKALEDPPYEVQYKEMTGFGQPVVLPKSKSTALLAQLLLKRRSCRNYQRREMPLAELAAILGEAYAITQLNRLPNGLSFFSRSVPSAGGLYPLEVYVLSQRVKEVADGIYHYNIPNHHLEPLRMGNCFSELGGYLVDQYYLVNANAIIIFSAVFGRTLTKYGARGYRYILLEAGHAAQNLCLLAAEQGLGSLCIGGFFDARLNRFLGLDGTTEAAVYCVVVGYTAE